MIQGRLCAIALALIGVWLLWNANAYVEASTARGFSRADTFTPEFVIRCVIAGLTFAAGALGIFSLTIGTWLGGLATLAMSLLTYLLVTAADVSLWQDDSLLLFAMMTVWLGMIAARGHVAAGR
ncbi:MAG: hypothetical protein AAFV54_08275 [Pseudomonadota bacterium]